MTDTYNAAHDGRASYELAIRCLRERAIRRREILPDPTRPEEVRWAAEGDAKPLEEARG